MRVSVSFLALRRFQQEFGRALDRGEGRFQLMRQMRREGRDVVRAPRQLPGHVEKASRQLRELARAVMLKRLEGVAVAAGNARCAADQLIHRARDGAGEHQPEACHVESCVKICEAQHDRRSCNSSEPPLQAFRIVLQNLCRRVSALESRRTH